MKHKPQNNLSLFESNDPPTPEERQETAIKRLVGDACPQCSCPAQKSVRAAEYGGLTHFCSQCKGSEPGEPFRFTP